MQFIDFTIKYWHQHTFLIQTILAFSIALSFCFKIIPTIVHISYEKNLLDIPNDRKLNKKPLPNLGGVAIFIATTLSPLIFVSTLQGNQFISITSSCLIVFFIGMKDDLIVIDPRKKLIGQLIAVSIVVFLGGIRFSNFNGFLNIFEINEYISLPLTFLFMILIINSFNLIDGIDGLASGVTILISFTYGIWFYLTNQLLFTFISFSLAGSLVSFFYYNVFSKNNKIFMGDSGSLLNGFLIGVLTIVLINSNADIINYKIDAIIPVILGILIVPIVDTLRVFVIRILNGKSPFSPDKNHIHHKLIELNFSHLQATLIIVGVNFIFIIQSFVLQKIGTYLLFSLILGLAVFFIYCLFLANKRHELRITKQNEAAILNASPANSLRELKKRTKKFSSSRVSTSPVVNSGKLRKRTSRL